MLASASDVDVRIENGVLVNPKANYYFALPIEWTVKDISDWQHLTVVHPGSGAAVTVRYEVARSDGNPLSLALVSALGPESSDFKPDKVGPARVGGQVAFDTQGARTGKDGVKERVRCLVTEVDAFTLSLTSTAAVTTPATVGEQIDRIITSFKFGKPTRKR